jgi:hypothetical protein
MKVEIQYKLLPLLIMLHNSCIPNDYKTIDEIFNSDILLSCVLKYLLNSPL